METIIDRQLPHDSATEWPVLNRRKLDLLLAKPEQSLSRAARGAKLLEYKAHRLLDALVRIELHPIIPRAQKTNGNWSCIGHRAAFC